MELEQTDVGAAPDPGILAADSSPQEESSSAEEANAGVVNAEDAKAVEQVEVDPLKDVPTLEELQKQAEQKVPYAQALANLRTAYEGVKPQLDQVKAYEPWKEVVDVVGDPVQAKTAYELVKSLRTPVEGNPNEYTSKPFIERIDQERPGSANQIFHDLLTYEVPDENGRTDTLVRHMYRSHGLDPDRIQDYRNIDTLRASGVVSAEDLNRIPEQYRDAFRSLSKDGQDDILELVKAGDPSYGLRAEEHLRNAQDALEARQWREQSERARSDEATRQQAEFQQQVVEAINQDVSVEVKGIHDSILQNLSSQFTFSSDATQNSLEHGKILGVLANLQSPYPVYRDMAIQQLKAVGVDVNGWEKLTANWEHERSKYVAFKQAGQENTWDAREALSKSTFAKQQILAKANDYALKLAQASGERAAGIATQQGSQLGAATARYVPSGTGQAQQGNPNPYKNNPYPIGSQEYFNFNREIDQQYKVSSASFLGG